MTQTSSYCVPTATFLGECKKTMAAIFFEKWTRNRSSMFHFRSPNPISWPQNSFWNLPTSSQILNLPFMMVRQNSGIIHGIFLPHFFSDISPMCRWRWWSLRDFSIVFVDRDDLRKNMCSSQKLLTFGVFPHLHNQAPLTTQTGVVCTHGNSHPPYLQIEKNLTPTNQHVNLQHVSTTSNRNQLLNCTFPITTTN